MAIEDFALVTWEKLCKHGENQFPVHTRYEVDKPSRRDVRSGPGMLSRGDLVKYSLNSFQVANTIVAAIASHVRVFMLQESCF